MNGLYNLRINYKYVTTMNVVLDIKKYNPLNIFFQYPIKNTIMDNSDFIRIIYSTDCFSLNGIYLTVNINFSGIESYYNKYKYKFNNSDNINIINKLIYIEKSILDRAAIRNKIPVYKLAEQLQSGKLRLFTNHNICKKSLVFVFKISGIWTSLNKNGEYGITYKFTEVE